MFFARFFAALLLAVSIAVAGVEIEQRILRYRQAISLDVHRLEVLDEQYARARLQVGRLGAPARILAQLREGNWSLEEPQQPELRAADRQTSLENGSLRAE